MKKKEGTSTLMFEEETLFCATEYKHWVIDSAESDK